MADKRAYFKVDVGYLTNPKISALLDDEPRAVLLHLCCIAYSAQHLTDGKVPMHLAMRLACAEQCDIDLLLHCGLLEQVDSRTVLVHDYLEHQRSAEEAKRASDKGKRAASARWSDAPGNASSNATGMPDAMPNPMPREREEREKNTPAVADGLFDEFWTRYPRKEGKGAARKAWAKAVKQIDAGELVNITRSYGVRMAGAEKRFIPHPATWLNQERWSDEVDDQKAEAADEWFRPFTLPECPPDIADDPERYAAWVDDQREAWRQEGGR